MRQAAAQGRALEAYAASLLEDAAHVPSQPLPCTLLTGEESRAASATNLMDLFEPIRGLLTDEEIDTWCGQRISIMWTAYDPSLHFSTRLTVPPGYFTSATALALSASSPVMIVPAPGRQFSGTRPSTRWFGSDCANFCARSTPVKELKLTIMNATIAKATAVFRTGINMASFQKNIMSAPEDMALAV